MHAAYPHLGQEQILSEERRTERKLIEDYVATIEGLLPQLDAARVTLATDIASIPELDRKSVV